MLSRPSSHQCPHDPAGGDPPHWALDTSNQPEGDGGAGGTGLVVPSAHMIVCALQGGSDDEGEEGSGMDVDDEGEGGDDEGEGEEEEEDDDDEEEGDDEEDVEPEPSAKKRKVGEGCKQAADVGSLRQLKKKAAEAVEAETGEGGDIVEGKTPVEYERFLTNEDFARIRALQAEATMENALNKVGAKRAKGVANDELEALKVRFPHPVPLPTLTQTFGVVAPVLEAAPAGLAWWVGRSVLIGWCWPAGEDPCGHLRAAEGEPGLSGGGTPQEARTQGGAAGTCHGGSRGTRRVRGQFCAAQDQDGWQEQP
jgi:hypothetical protein